MILYSPPVGLDDAGVALRWRKPDFQINPALGSRWNNGWEWLMQLVAPLTEDGIFGLLPPSRREMSIQ